MLVRTQFIVPWNCSLLKPTNLIQKPSQTPSSEENIRNTSHHEEETDVQMISDGAAHSVNGHEEHGTATMQSDDYIYSIASIQTSNALATTQEDEEDRQQSAALAELKDNLRRYLPTVAKQYEPLPTMSKWSVSDRISIEHDMINLEVVQQHEEETCDKGDEHQQNGDNTVARYHGILSQRPVKTLLDSPIPSYIGSDYREGQSIADGETVTAPHGNLVYYKRREDFYPNKMIEQEQEKSDLSPAANDDYSRRQNTYMILGRATTKVHPGTIVKDSGMPIFKPSEVSKKPKAIFRRIKTLIKKRK